MPNSSMRMPDGGGDGVLGEGRSPPLDPHPCRWIRSPALDPCPGRRIHASATTTSAPRAAVGAACHPPVLRGGWPLRENMRGKRDAESQREDAWMRLERLERVKGCALVEDCRVAGLKFVLSRIRTGRATIELKAQ
ncbi:hypothetical protein GUJ93_ZPchr0010g10325 [Zizania palustris]|uniref:Uncharacterized protein n=1 Tax=Zizania palustris TaxID=103762 RepID=A0A8J5W775_ZIZPA|nr:hypothetical protein GUJ93_ZPchr0010g10325 [Zizania palustris]